MGKLSLRPATRDDARMIFEWRNDPWIVERGSSNRAVTWDEHEAWFGQALANADMKIFVAEHEGKPIGQVRFQRSNANEAVIAVYLLRDHVGQGLGVEAIRDGSRAILNAWPVQRVHARVLNSNAQSVRAFEKAGFVKRSAEGDHSNLYLNREEGGRS
jgi:UDP-2,4-diacetamido-2,4,6-trideoxy-beta-L-altropyranose hydrolase